MRAVGKERVPRGARTVDSLLAVALASVLFGCGLLVEAAGLDEGAGVDEAFATVVWIEDEEEDDADEDDTDTDTAEDADEDEGDSDSASSDDDAVASLGSSLADIATDELTSDVDEAADDDETDETSAEDEAGEEEEEEEEDDPLATEALDADDNEVNPSQLPDSSFIYDTSIEDLATADTYYDGQTVQVVGEVVGDKLNADASGTYCWITLSSQSSDYSISVYMNSVAASAIDTYGAYGSTGTILQVRGTFNLSCDEHDGETDLHAEVVTVTARGETEEEEFDFDDFLPGACAVGFGLALMLVFYLLRERLR